MLSSINLKSQRKRDMRFADPERIRKKSKAKRGHISSCSSELAISESIAPAWVKASGTVASWPSQAAENQNFVGEVNIIEFANETFRRQNMRRVLKTLKADNNPTSQPKTARSSSTPSAASLDFPFVQVKEVAERASKPVQSWGKYAEDDFVSSIGVFSDTRSYSALIKNELQQHQVNVKHFNHPSTFKPTNFAHLDQVSAWLLFLSEECNEEFIDSFLERYIDKPTLFLCPKMKRDNASSKIMEFLKQNKLARN